MFKRYRDEDDLQLETTLSTEDWEGAHHAQGDSLRIVLAAGDDPGSAAAVMITGWMAQQVHLHPVTVHVLDLDQPTSSETTAYHLANTVRALGGLPTSWPPQVEGERFSDMILHCAQTFKANLIVLGRHQMPPETVEQPSDRANTSRLVMEGQRIPVLAVHPDAFELPRCIVVAVDFQRASLSAARLACEIANIGSTIYLAHVYSGDVDGALQNNTERRTAARDIGIALAKLKEFLAQREDITVKTVILLGDPIVELHSFLHHIHPDLTVLGTRGRDRDPQQNRGLGAVTRALIDDPAVSSVLVAPPAPAVIRVWT